MTDEKLEGILSGIQVQTAQLQAESARMWAEMQRHFEENAAAHVETRRRMQWQSEENAAAHVETRRLFEVALEEPKHAIQLLAENVSHLNEKVASLDQRVSSLDEKVDRTAAETQAMIRFVHTDLDRRLRVVESR